MASAHGGFQGVAELVGRPTTVAAVGLIITLAIGLLAAPPAADAQQPAKVPRRGYLHPEPISARLHLLDAFRQGLRELGYVEGQTIALEVRSAEGKWERLPALAELVRLKVDVIVTATARLRRFRSFSEFAFSKRTTTRQVEEEFSASN